MKEGGKPCDAILEVAKLPRLKIKPTLQLLDFHVISGRGEEI